MGHEHTENGTDENIYMDCPVPFVTATAIIAALGIASNMFLFWVWLGEKGFNVTPFLFKYLAICDIVYLFSFPFSLGTSFGPTEVTFSEDTSMAWHHFSDLGQMMSVHTTLLICVSRWIAVVYPFQARVWLFAHRIYTACFFLFLWCLVLEAGDILFGTHIECCQGNIRHNHHDILEYHTIKRIVGFMLPCTLMIIFSMRLLRGFFRHEQRMSRHKGKRRLILPVVIISFTSFLAYPVSEAILITTTRVLAYDSIYSNQFSFIGFFLQMSNSSLNLYVYWGTSARFRQLVKDRKKRREHWRASGGPRVFPAAGIKAAAATDNAACTLTQKQTSNHTVLVSGESSDSSNGLTLAQASSTLHNSTEAELEAAVPDEPVHQAGSSPQLETAAIDTPMNRTSSDRSASRLAE